MQMICADANCSNMARVTVYGVPVSLVCPKCGGLRVMFDEDVEISDPQNGRPIGKLQQGKAINADELRDVRLSPYRRAFLLRGLGGISSKPLPPPPPSPLLPPPPPRPEEGELTGADAIPKPEPVGEEVVVRRRGRPKGKSGRARGIKP